MGIFRAKAHDPGLQNLAGNLLGDAKALLASFFNLFGAFWRPPGLRHRGCGRGLQGLGVRAAPVAGMDGCSCFNHTPPRDG